MENININFENYTDDFKNKLLDICFKYFDSNIENDLFEDISDSLIKDFPNYKPSDIKFILKRIIEFIENNYLSDEGVITQQLKLFSKLDLIRNLILKTSSTLSK
jgi:hypothetical protein